MLTYTSQAVDGDQVEEPQEKLVAEEDCREQIAQNQGSQVVLCVGELAEGSHDDAGKVQGHDQDEELAVGVEPQLKTDPCADLALRPRRLLGLRGRFGGFGGRACHGQRH